MYVTQQGIVKLDKVSKANADLIERLIGNHRNAVDAKFVIKHFPDDIPLQFAYIIRTLCKEYKLLEKQLLKTQTKVNAIQPKAKEGRRRDKSNS